MIKTEAIWIRERLIELQPKSVLNCGSSTLHFRTIEQPWITEALERFEVVHLDKKRAEGVDLVSDLENDDLVCPKYDVVLLTSVLEHVIERDKVMGNVANVTGKWLIVTVPYEWPYHPDPIDTGYRPSLQELTSYIEPFGFIWRLRESLKDPRGSCSAVLFERVTK